MFFCAVAHPDGRPVRRLPLHGGVFTERHSGLCPSVSLARWASRAVRDDRFVLQLFDRVKLFGMPSKHQPDLIYLRYVPLWKVHIFTAVQVACLVVLWAIKASVAAAVFPMMVRRLTVGLVREL